MQRTVIGVLTYRRKRTFDEPICPPPFQEERVAGHPVDRPDALSSRHPPTMDLWVAQLYQGLFANFMLRKLSCN